VNRKEKGEEAAAEKLAGNVKYIYAAQGFNESNTIGAKLGRDVTDSFLVQIWTSIPRLPFYICV